MVDILQVLEGLAYAGFIAGAIFAVVELRTISRDRKTELLMRSAEFGCTLEFETASAKLIKARFKTPEEAEEQLSLPVLLMLCDYCETIGTLAQRKLVPKNVALDIYPFEYIWDKVKVWADASSDIDDPERDKYGSTYPSFRWLAGEARKRRLAGRDVRERIGEGG